jgi:hypothetical protein
MYLGETPTISNFGDKKKSTNVLCKIGRNLLWLAQWKMDGNKGKVRVTSYIK